MARVGIIGAFAGSLVLLAGGHGRADSPLPAFATRVQPVVHFLLDSSGSMDACDGGLVNEAQDLVPVMGGGYLFNPRLDRSDDGACNGGARTAGTPYQISRMEAVKLSLSKILDADGNGLIDSSDEVVLRLKVGMSQFAANDPYRTNLTTLRPIGASFASIWESVRGMTTAGNTPSGPALAGARALSIANCWDGDPGTACNLGPKQTKANGDDLAVGCRDYYVIFLTDGEPNQNSSAIAFDPIPVARALREKGKSVGTEPAHQAMVRTIAIGFGADVTPVGSRSRGVINCMAFWGSDAANKVTDADKDGDGDFRTMDDDADGSTPGSNASCTGIGSLSAAEKGYGHGYFATDSRALSNAFQKILNAIQAGTYSRAEPTLAGRATVGTKSIYGAYFEIPSNALDWRGHLKKYAYDGADETPSYVDCDNPSATSTPPVPCWDAGRLLLNRDWRTRRVFTVNASLYGSRLAWEPDLSQAARVGWTGSDASRPMTVKNVVPALATIGNIANPAAPTSGTDLYRIAAMSTFRDGDTLYTPDAVVPNAGLVSAVKALSFAAGRPDATFADGSLRCGSASCDASTPSPKLGDSFNSRPVVVGPPLGLTSDPDFIGEFQSRPLTTYSGDEAVRIGNAVASPCPAGVTDCTVSRRRTVVYLAANDGAVHAFDDETGAELWAFIPPGHLPRLGLQREGRAAYVDAPPVVRDVKFPCVREPNGACKDGAANPAFADGKWHTVLFYGQGMGGNFYFALDVTNPVAPVFLWETRDPARMGFTLASPGVAELPSSLPTLNEPGSAVFAPGGYRPSGTGETLFQTLRVFDGATLAAKKTDPHDLADDETRPEALGNGHTGTPRIVDGNLDGDVDRVYFGDREGRLWKACRLQPNGNFDLAMFFDPALYDRQAGGTVGQPSDKDRPTTGVSSADPRKRLRGPVFFAPDVTRNQQGELIVAFGSGNLQDPLSPPEAYRNFIWGVTDDPSLADSGCRPAQRNAFRAGADGTVTLQDDSETATFEKVHPLDMLLSAPPLIFDGKLYYAEYDPDPDGNVCTDDYMSRVIAVSTFDGGEPASPPFRDDAGQPTNEKEYVNQLVTGIDIDPRSGTVFVSTSKGGEEPDDVRVPDQAMGTVFAGWRTRE